jgi:hypothetical protein
MTTIRALSFAGLLALALSAGQGRADAPGYPPEAMIAKVEPASAAPGTKVTITGLSFVPGAEVWIGGAEATDVKVLTPDTIVVTVPEHAPGPAAVQVRLPMWRSAYGAHLFTFR